MEALGITTIIYRILGILAYALVLYKLGERIKTIERTKRLKGEIRCKN